MGDPTSSDLAVVIMAGGSGTRFWPVSTEARPKQFLTLFGDRSMLQRTYDRVAGLVPPERVLVLTSARFTDLVAEQLPELPAGNIVGEPVPRDTSGAVALAAVLCRARFGDPVMAVLTADHRIEPAEAFHAALRSAARGARESGALYTFGVAPSYPATGYGYLESGQRLDADGDVEHFELLRFREKPDRATAERFLATGRHSWNSGMFVWTTAAIWDAIEAHLPDHARHLAPLAEADGTDRWEDALRAGFEPLPKISIDFGVMEKAAAVRMVRATFEWSDVGGWLALEEFLAADEHGNTARGELHALDAAGNLVFCEDAAETVALVGVEDLVVVRSGPRTLVTRRDTAEQIKALVQAMQRD